MKTTTKQKAEEYSSPIMDEVLNQISPGEQKRTDQRMLLAARIDDAIKAKGWKKKDLALALNKRPSEITKWLSGTHNFTTDTLWDIERVLDIELILLDNQEEEIKIQFNIISIQNKVQNQGDENLLDYQTRKKIRIKQYPEIIKSNQAFQA